MKHSTMLHHWPERVNFLGSFVKQQKRLSASLCQSVRLHGANRL